MDPRATFYAGQAAAAGAEIAARAEAVGALRVDRIPNALADLVRVLVADAEIGCPLVRSTASPATSARYTAINPPQHPIVRPVKNQG